MRRILDKKGVSTMVEYVLLIVIAISLSTVVYVWLKNYIPKNTADCPESVSIVITDYNCNGKILDITLMNKGNFNIEGYISRITNSSGGINYNILSRETLSILGKEKSYNYFYLDEGLVSLKPNEEYKVKFDYADYHKLETIEIQPFTFPNGQLVLCGKAIISQKLDNCI